MKSKGRTPPTAEQAHYHDTVRDVGCLVCRSPASIHHVRDGLGMGQKVNHWRVLPLCYEHHQADGAGDISIHGSPKEFRELYGSEVDLEIKLRGELNGM